MTLLMALWGSPLTTLAAEPKAFQYDSRSVEPATYYAAISNLAYAVMFSGLGEPLVISPYERDDWLRRAGYVVRPAMPDMAIVGPVYSSARPRFAQRPDPGDPETLRWREESFDRSLDPAAQAWALLKITAPQFHLQFHELPENRLAALMMVPQARALAKLLDKRLRNRDGLFATRSARGSFQTPEPRSQAAVLWAVSNLILAGSSPRSHYWHRAYRELTDADDYRPLAEQAFAAVNRLPARTPVERAITIAALGRYALAVDSGSQRQLALKQARQQAQTLSERAPATGLEDLALSIYGLVEASRLLGEPAFARAAATLFSDRLLPRWSEKGRLFITTEGPIRYSPTTVGALVAAINAMRWYGAELSLPKALIERAGAIYPQFFQTAIIDSGLLAASPLALVSQSYRDERPAAHFAHPKLADPTTTGTAPVFRSEVTYEAGRWRVTDGRFSTASALFLANMLAIKGMGGSDEEADPFLPAELLATIH